LKITKGLSETVAQKSTDYAMAKRNKDKAIACSRHKIAGKNADVALSNNSLLTHSHITN
jgi:hypothetical protein